VTLKDLRYS